MCLGQFINKICRFNNLRWSVFEFMLYCGSFYLSHTDLSLFFYSITVRDFDRKNNRKKFLFKFSFNNFLLEIFLLTEQSTEKRQTIKFVIVKVIFFTIVEDYATVLGYKIFASPDDLAFLMQFNNSNPNSCNENDLKDLVFITSLNTFC